MGVLTWSEIQLPEDFYELIYYCDWIYESEWEPEWEWIELSASEWIGEAWEILTEAGLASYRTEADHCEVLITFLALICLYIESYGFASEEWCLEWAEELEIRACHVRQLFGNIFALNFDENEDEDELDRNKLWYLVKDAHKQVVAVLAERFGTELGVSASIWQSIQAKIEQYDQYEENDYEYNFFRTEAEIITNAILEEEIDFWIERYESKNRVNEELGNYATDTETINELFFVSDLNIPLDESNSLVAAMQCLAQFFEGEIIEFEESNQQKKSPKLTQVFQQAKPKQRLTKCTPNIRSNRVVKMSNDVNPKCPFSTKTFELFEELCGGTYDFSLAYIEFKEFLEKPFQQLCHQVATQLPDQISERLEPKGGVFHGIIGLDSDEYDAHGQFKIDYTFYFHERKKANEAQFFVQLNEELLKFGFYVGHNSNSWIQFAQNCQKNKQELDCILWDNLGCNDNLLYYYSFENDEIELTWKDWLKYPIYPEVYATGSLTANEVLQCSTEKLSRHITQTFARFFPLILLATSDNPMPAIREYLNLPKPEYPLEECAEDVGIHKAELERWVRAIERKGQVIFYGSPGTGKTFIAEQLARYLSGDNDERWEVVQFHPAYSYEDFIQGIRPQSQNGALTYPLVPGRFLEFCEKANSCQGLCVLIIDEINRANLAQVFGELMYLLEYRDKKIRLAGSSELFSIPKNVRIIGTMNTADRSIALVDHALRRRFAFIELRPNYQVLRRYHEKKETGFQVDGLIDTLKRLNNAIANKHYEVGISFFLTENLADELEDIWQMEIEPYLEEYFYDQLDKVDEFRWDNIKQQVRS
jgi:5-methylcytosine-specific restriction protein B